MAAQLYERDDDRLDEESGKQEPRSAHSFAVLSTHSVKIDGETVQLVKVRDGLNARKHYESQLQYWFSPFSNWTDELRKKLKVSESEEQGVIFLTLDEYLAKFRSTIICFASWKTPERQTP